MSACSAREFREASEVLDVHRARRAVLCHVISPEQRIAGKGMVAWRLMSALDYGTVNVKKPYPVRGIILMAVAYFLYDSGYRQRGSRVSLTGRSPFTSLHCVQLAREVIVRAPGDSAAKTDFRSVECILFVGGGVNSGVRPEAVRWPLASSHRVRSHYAQA
ncbi:hypothetical protein C0Q70_16850 [Pomacea canaliculata]|uniref:Uncharacterized protein n=1 Tax=Pomacea canaliculata TaxID=400727 RepID=A0A2T7NQZ0_POMCA|nr:hypothetical protein C0Q70_16850 [Pomacea canaliculata]